MPQGQLVDRTILAEELRALAEHDLLTHRAEELTGLADDLAAKKDLAKWAELDLVRAFASPDFLVEPERREGRFREHSLEAVLGVLVFAPLLVTWLGLHEATKAYEELADADPEQATRPFLQLWQTGFGGRLPGWAEFSTMAGYALFLIFVLIAVSVEHGLARRRELRAQADRDHERDAVLGRLASVLTRVQLSLSDHRLVSPRRFTDELSKAATRLADLTVQAHETSSILRDTSERVLDATGSLHTASDTMTAQVPVFAGAAGNVEDAVRTGVDGLHTAHDAVLKAGKDTEAALTKVGDRVEDALTAFADRVAGVGSDIDTAVKELTAVQRSLLGAAESSAQTTDRAAVAMSESADKVGDAVEGMRQATERWDIAAAHWQDAAARVEEKTRLLGGGSGAPPVPAYRPTARAAGAERTSP